MEDEGPFMVSRGIRKIVSGGQTGVDRAALDVALEKSLPCGGWCPRGRRAEDGRLPDRYPLQETPQTKYAQRTEWNVRDSDGTLILTLGEPVGGTALTKAHAERIGRPCLMVDLGGPSATGPATMAAVAEWLSACRIEVLNVAGPRESQQPGIYEKAVCLLRNLLETARL